MPTCQLEEVEEAFEGFTPGGKPIVAHGVKPVRRKAKIALASTN
jgi:hypothetical protein